MNPAQALRASGQSLWLDSISRSMVADGALESYIKDFAVTGLTSNPTIFQKAIAGSNAYQEQIVTCKKNGLSDEETFFTLALSDLQQAADLFYPAYQQSGGIDGFVSLEVSPELADDSEKTIEQVALLHSKAARPNLFVKIPGTKAGLAAIEESIYRGLPINVTLLFSVEQYLAAADAYYKGIERRLADGFSPAVASVASLFVSRWDVAVKDSAPGKLANRLGLAVGAATYRAYRRLLASKRHRELIDLGARPQRLLFASTGSKDPHASDILYVAGLAAPETINTMPPDTLFAYAAHGPEAPRFLDADGGRQAQLLEEFVGAGIDLTALAEQLQQEGVASFYKSWQELLSAIAAKRAPVTSQPTL